MDEKDSNRRADAAEELSRAARESYRVAVDRAFEVQKSNMKLSRSFFENWVQTLEDHAELGRRTAEEMTDLVREQQGVFRRLSKESVEAYDGFVDSLASYQKDAAGDPTERERP